MDRKPIVPGGEEDSLLRGCGLGHWTYRLCVNDICISIDDCPECLRRKDFDCRGCEFFPPASCPLLNEPYLLRETRTLFSICREQRALEVERQRRLVRAVYSELKAHGRPLHCTVLARMVADRHPELDISSHGIAVMMSAHSRLFERVREGVYRCKRNRGS